VKLSAETLINAMKKVRELDDEMPAQTLLTLLVVYRRDGSITQFDLRSELGVASSTAARISGRLGPWEKFPAKPGLGLIHSEQDPHDRRFRILSLTAKGRSFIDSVLKEIHK